MFSVYRKGQGASARISVGVALCMIAIFAAYSLHGALVDLPLFFGGVNIPLLSLPLTWGLVSSFAFFLFCIAVVAVFVGCIETGVQRIDRAGQFVVEFLIEAQAELQKVSWPTRQELVGSTIVVLICAVILAAFVFGVDRFVTAIMKALNVL